MISRFNTRGFYFWGVLKDTVRGKKKKTKGTAGAETSRSKTQLIRPPLATIQLVCRSVLTVTEGVLIAVNGGLRYRTMEESCIYLFSLIEYNTSNCVYIMLRRSVFIHFWRDGDEYYACLVFTFIYVS